MRQIATNAEPNDVAQPGVTISSEPKAPVDVVYASRALRRLRPELYKCIRTLQGIELVASLNALATIFVYDGSLDSATEEVRKAVSRREEEPAFNIVSSAWLEQCHKENKVVPFTSYIRSRSASPNSPRASMMVNTASGSRRKSKPPNRFQVQMRDAENFGSRPLHHAQERSQDADSLVDEVRHARGQLALPSPPTTTTKKKRGGTNANASKRHVFYMSDSISASRLSEYRRCIEELGGSVLPQQHDVRKCTHVLTANLSRGETLLTAMLLGKWILRPSYIEASVRERAFASEQEHDWAGSASGLGPNGQDIAGAIRHWRSTANGPFVGVDALLCLANDSLDTYARLLRVGGAASVVVRVPPFTSSKQTPSFTHAFFDDLSFERFQDVFQHLQAVNVSCVRVDFITSCILKAGSVSVSEFVVRPPTPLPPAVPAAVRHAPSPSPPPSKSSRRRSASTASTTTIRRSARKRHKPKQ